MLANLLFFVLLLAATNSVYALSIETSKPTNGTTVVLDETARIHFQLEDSAEEFTITHLKNRNAEDDLNSYYFNAGSSAHVLTKPREALRLSLDLKSNALVYSVNPIDLRFLKGANQTKILEITTKNDLKLSNGDLKFLDDHLKTIRTEKIQPTQNKTDQLIRIPFEYPLKLVFDLTIQENATKRIVLEAFDDFSAFPHRLGLQFNSTSDQALLSNLENLNSKYLHNKVFKVAEVTRKEVLLASPENFSPATQVMISADNCEKKDDKTAAMSTSFAELICDSYKVCYIPCSIRLYEPLSAQASALKTTVAEMSFAAPNNQGASIGSVLWILAAIIGLGLISAAIYFGARRRNLL